MNKAAAITTAITLLLAPAALVMSSPASARPEAPRQDQVRTTYERIADYWTPARRASAVPRYIQSPEMRAKGGKSGDNRSARSTSAVTGSTWSDPTVPVARTTGRVFFTLGGTTYFCSGSAVEGGGVDLVLTAGHCLWDDTRGFVSNWVFYPGYEGGPSSTYGAWTASALFTTTQWSGAGLAFPDDAGLAMVTDGSSGSLATTLGALPTMASQSGQNLSGAVYSAFGYPAAQKYQGATLTYCQGPVQSGTGRDANTMSMACDMTGGSSGGPWFSAPDGTGQIVSVNSYGYDGLARMFGPTFDGAETAMYSAASDGLCDAAVEVCKTVAP